MNLAISCKGLLLALAEGDVDIGVGGGVAPWLLLLLRYGGADGEGAGNDIDEVEYLSHGRKAHKYNEDNMKWSWVFATMMIHIYTDCLVSRRREFYHRQEMLTGKEEKKEGKINGRMAGGMMKQ
jgi:hypothetical protein